MVHEQLLSHLPADVQVAQRADSIRDVDSKIPVTEGWGKPPPEKGGTASRHPSPQLNPYCPSPSRHPASSNPYSSARSAPRARRIHVAVSTTLNRNSTRSWRSARRARRIHVAVSTTLSPRILPVPLALRTLLSTPSTTGVASCVLASLPFSPIPPPPPSWTESEGQAATPLTYLA